MLCIINIAQYVNVEISQVIIEGNSGMVFQKNRQKRLIVRHHLLTLFLLCVVCNLTSCDSDSTKTVVNLDDRVTDQELLKLNQNKNQKNHKTLYFGFDLRASPQEDSSQYIPFLRYLEKSTGYNFELRFTPQGRSIIDELGTGKVDLAAVGAVSYIKGHEKYGIINLVRGLNQKGKAKYQSMIVVNPNSSIKSIDDLKHKRFAFGNINSTQGHLIPRISLREHGIDLKDLKSYEFTGSHIDCANSVVSFKFDACGMQDTMAEHMVKEGLLKILHISRYHPSSGIAANQELPLEIISKVKKALIDFDPRGKNKDKLHHWSQTEMPNGFIAAYEKDYLEIRNWLIKFGIIKPSPKRSIYKK